MEAGQVWYPNSSFKTATAIKDFNREGLPLVLVANVRGFSGGQGEFCTLGIALTGQPTCTTRFSSTVL